MGKINLVKNIANEAAAWAKASGKSSILQTKPIQNINFEGLHFAKALKTDTVQFSKALKPKFLEIVPENTKLFSWAKPKPVLSFKKIAPESLAMVHMTQYYPKNGEILSTRLATATKNGVGEARSTIHFALNKSVTEHAYGNGWQAMDCAVIAPFKETVAGMPKSKVIGGIQDDFFVLDRVKLPKNSVIVKYNSNIPKGQMQISETAEGLKLVESSNQNMGEVANIVVNKMGFQNYSDALIKHLGATGKDAEYFKSTAESNITDFFDKIEKMGGPKKAREIMNKNIKNTQEYADFIPKENLEASIKAYKEAIEKSYLAEKYSAKMKDFPKAWDAFCKDSNYITGLHSSTPWFNAEMSVTTIGIVEKLNKNSWGNCKELVLENLSKAESAIIQGKELGYDIKALKRIVQDSNTPKEALEKMSKELKIKPMPPKDKSAFENPEELPAPLEVMLSMLFL